MESQTTAHLKKIAFYRFIVKCKMAVKDFRRMNTHCVGFNIGGTAAGHLHRVLIRCNKDILGAFTL